MSIKSALLFAGLIASNAAGAMEDLPQAAARTKSPPDSRTIVRDGRVKVSYGFDGSAIQFVSDLPADWSFSVAVDGDQNGRWGSGPGEPRAEVVRSPDFTIGQDAKNGIFCGQYIFTSSASDPDQIYMSSDCDMFITQGSVIMSQMSATKSATITYRLPIEKFFGQQSSARVQVCVWDTQRSTCYFSPAKPFVIQRPAAAS